MLVRPRQVGGGSSQPDQGCSTRVEVSLLPAAAQQELGQEEEECFAWATAKLALGDSTIEEYFDRLIDHIRQGGARHTWDKSNSSVDDVLRVDLIAGAFKSRMLKRGLGRISHAEGERLKALCLLFYREAELAELQRRIELDIGVALTSLPLWTVDILGVIAYARRHVDVLKHLVENYRASSRSAKSMFDLLGPLVLRTRHRTSITFQHSPDTEHNCEQEWRMWTALLESRPGTWLHYPLRGADNSVGTREGLFHSSHNLADLWEKDHELRNSPLYLEYLRSLKLQGLVFSAYTISRFLSITAGSSIQFRRGGPFVPISAEAARKVLDLFPLNQSFGANYRGTHSAEVAMPITQWPTDNPDRLVVMEMLLKQGLDVNGTLRTNDNSERLGPEDFEDQKHDTCLALAASRGDAEMVDLLLRYGARMNIKDARGGNAAQRARINGHVQLYNRLKSL
ncbi:hypothetical protein GQ53DRAFT_845197 [Thozetella sp. PMI_491]|nr:hypothetical protein GQ53DRAFT_845197 [Thozetella sp. PMI_491]